MDDALSPMPAPGAPGHPLTAVVAAVVDAQRALARHEPTRAIALALGVVVVELTAIGPGLDPGLVDHAHTCRLIAADLAAGRDEHRGRVAAGRALHLVDRACRSITSRG